MAIFFTNRGHRSRNSPAAHRCQRRRQRACAPADRLPALPRLLLALLLAPASALCLACGDDQILTTTRNLDRPGPLALVCAGRVGDAGVTTGLGASACTSDAGVGGSPRGTLYGFVANTARGEVAVFRPGSSGERLLDLDKANPGFGFIPIGVLPTDLEATSDGCRVYSANSGSCDLSAINVPAVMQVSAGELAVPAGGVTTRVIPRTAAGPLRARPQEIVIVPASVPATPAGSLPTCPSPAAYRAYVTFPRCNLVAEVDLATGRILQGIHVGPDGFRLTTDPVCPVECTMRGEAIRVDSGPLDLGPADAGVPDSPAATDALPGLADGGGDLGEAGDLTAAADTAPADGFEPADATANGERGVSAEGVLPYGLTLSESGDQLFVSSAGAGFISAISIDAEGQLTAAAQIPLAGGARTTRIRLSPPTRELGQFIYAVASDRSVRVVSLELRAECETNIDLAALPDGGVPLDRGRCFAVGGAETPPRRVSEEGAGLRFGLRVPADIVFVENRAAATDAGPASDAAVQATPLDGIFALVAVSDGLVYVVNVEDWSVTNVPAGTLAPLSLPHRVRNSQMGLPTSVPDASVVAVRGAKSGGVPGVVSEVTPPGSDAAVPLPGEGVFLRAPGETVAKDWNLVYEERLVARWSGNVVASREDLSLRDRGAFFCRAGVEGRELEEGRPLRHGDIVVVVGCRDDSECGLGQTCVKSVSNPSEYGLCLDASRQSELFAACSVYLDNSREFLVTEAYQDRLSLDVLPHQPQGIIKQGTQPAGGCRSNSDCAPNFLCALANQVFGAVGLRQGECFRPGCQSNEDCPSGVCVQPLDGAPRVCATVPLPIEIGPGCSTDADCSPPPSYIGALCVDDRDCPSALLECRKATSASLNEQCLDKGMFCADYPGLRGRCVRRSPCFNELIRYDVRAGRSFVLGSYNRRAVDPLTGRCGIDSSRSPLLADRIPIGLPIYPVLLGPTCQSPVQPLELPQPNPCFERVDEGYLAFTDKGGGTTAATQEAAPSTVVRFSNPDLWFSLGLSHLTRPPPAAAGADAGVGDALAFPPMPERALTIQLELLSGFEPLRAGGSSVVALPARLAVGPDGYVYLVDGGDRPGSTGSYGQVLRINRSTVQLDNFVVK